MNTNVIEEYMNKVYTLVLLVITGACMIAGVFFSGLKLAGYYPAVSWLALGIFLGTCIVYVCVGQWFIRHGYYTNEAGEKRIRPDMLKRVKIFVFILMVVQFNFVSYMIPSRQWWACAFFFLILDALFLDLKMTVVTSVCMRAI